MNSQETFLIPADTIHDTHNQSSIEMITKAVELAGSGYTAILGCGKCTNIPIHFLSEIFDRIDLVDINLDALQFVKSIYQAWEETKSVCVFYHEDLTGLVDQIKPEAQEITAKVSDPITCLDHLARLLTSTLPKFWATPKNEKYNLIICSGVLTQLQASVRGRVEDIFLNRFPEHQKLLSSHDSWRKHIWDFARHIENTFIDHLTTLAASEAIIYLSDTIQVCWLIKSSPRIFKTEGTWIATRTSRLADYLNPSDKIILEKKWNRVKKEDEGPYWGRLYGVQSIIYQPS